MRSRGTAFAAGGVQAAKAKPGEDGAPLRSREGPKVPCWELTEDMESAGHGF